MNNLEIQSIKISIIEELIRDTTHSTNDLESTIKKLNPRIVNSKSIIIINVV